MEFIHINSTDKECRFLYRLLKLRPKEACISHKKMPTYLKHLAHVACPPYHSWYIIRHHRRWVGAIYLSFHNEIGVSLIPAAQGKGLAKRAIHALMKKHPRKSYLANVAPGNEASHKLFSKLGKVIQMTYEIDSPC